MPKSGQTDQQEVTEGGGIPPSASPTSVSSSASAAASPSASAAASSSAAPPESPPPPWLGAVKMAVVVMSALIVVGLGLLVYGLAVGLGRGAAGGVEITLNHPPGAELISVARGTDGVHLLHFRTPDGDSVVLMLAPDGNRILGRITLNEAADFGLAPH